MVVVEKSNNIYNNLGIVFLTLILLYLSCFISHRIFNYNIKSKFFLFIIINILFVYLGLVKVNSLIFFICGLIVNINGSKKTKTIQTRISKYLFRCL